MDAKCSCPSVRRGLPYHFLLNTRQSEVDAPQHVSRKANEMKKMLIAAILSLLVFANVTAQKRVARVQVKPGQITALPAGKPYVIDLTRGRKVYSVPASVDHSRVRVRTQTGELVLSDMMKRMGLSGDVTVASPGDMREVNFMRTVGSGRGLSYLCGDDVCICKGFSDCLLLDLDG